MRGGDHADDGQAQPVPVTIADPGRGQPLERLQQSADLTGWDIRPAVGHRQHHLAVPLGGADLDGAAGNVVPHGVVHQVGHQAGDQVRVAEHRRRAERGLDVQPAAPGLGGSRLQAGRSHLGQVGGLVLADPGLAGRC